MPRHLGPGGGGGTLLPRHMGPPGPKIGRDPHACDTGCVRCALMSFVRVRNRYSSQLSRSRCHVSVADATWRQLSDWNSIVP